MNEIVELDNVEEEDLIVEKNRKLLTQMTKFLWCVFFLASVFCLIP